MKLRARQNDRVRFHGSGANQYRQLPQRLGGQLLQKSARTGVKIIGLIQCRYRSKQAFPSALYFAKRGFAHAQEYRDPLFEKTVIRF